MGGMGGKPAAALGLRLGEGKGAGVRFGVVNAPQDFYKKADVQEKVRGRAEVAAKRPEQQPQLLAKQLQAATPEAKDLG